MVPSLDEFLSGMTPELNDDGFDTLKGIYRVVIKNEEKAETGFMITTFSNGDKSQRFQITADVVDVLKCNGSAGRRVWLRYNEDEKGVKKLINDLFTAGLLDKVDRSSVKQLKATLPDLVGSVSFLKLRGWTPTKTRDGQEIAESDRKTLQQGNFITEKEATKQASVKKDGDTPF